MPNLDKILSSSTKENAKSRLEIAPAPTEEVLDEFEQEALSHKEDLTTEDGRIKTFHALHEKLDRFENHEMKQLYDEGRLPTLESLEKAATLAQTSLSAKMEPEAERISKLLSGAVPAIRRWCRSYVASLVRFRRSRTAFLRMDAEEHREALRRADEDRRRIHNSLLESLAAFNQLIIEADDWTEFPQPQQWSPGDQWPPDFSHERIASFSKQALESRDLIRDWSIVADRIEQIHKLTGLTQAVDQVK